MRKKRTLSKDIDDTELNRNMHELFISKKYVELMIYCTKIESKDPLNLNALKYEAYALYFMGLYKAAISCYDKAISIEPDNPSLHSGKSKALDKLGKFEEAKKCYNKARELANTSDLGHNKNEWGT